MLRLALDALVNIDPDLAERVRQSDDAVDRIHAQACEQIEAAIQENPADTGRLLRLLNVTRQLERIADHTVNIAEDVIYMARGEFLRHRAVRHASARIGRHESERLSSWIMPKSTILIVGSEEPLTAALSVRLQDDGCEVLASTSVGDGMQPIQALLPDVVVTSDRLSDADLLRLCRHLRSSLADQHLALLMLVSPEDDALADDSAAPRDTVAEDLLADQIRAWLRCAAIIRHNRDRVQIDGLSVDRRRFAATLDGHDLPLTPTEFRLLWTLARRPGHVFSRAQLCEVLRHDDLTAQERTIDVHVKSIRQKLAHRGELIETVRGVGYRMRSAVEDHAPEGEDELSVVGAR